MTWKKKKHKPKHHKNKQPEIFKKQDLHRKALLWVLKVEPQSSPFFLLLFYVLCVSSTVTFPSELHNRWEQLVFKRFLFSDFNFSCVFWIWHNTILQWRGDIVLSLIIKGWNPASNQSFSDMFMLSLIRKNIFCSYWKKKNCQRQKQNHSLCSISKYQNCREMSEECSFVFSETKSNSFWHASPDVV